MLARHIFILPIVFFIYPILGCSSDVVVKFKFDGSPIVNTIFKITMKCGNNGESLSLSTDNSGFGKIFLNSKAENCTLDFSSHDFSTDYLPTQSVIDIRENIRRTGEITVNLLRTTKIVLIKDKLQWPELNATYEIDVEHVTAMGVEENAWLVKKQSYRSPKRIQTIPEFPIKDLLATPENYSYVLISPGENSKNTPSFNDPACVKQFKAIILKVEASRASSSGQPYSIGVPPLADQWLVYVPNAHSKCLQ